MQVCNDLPHEQGGGAEPSGHDAGPACGRQCCRRGEVTSSSISFNICLSFLIPHRHFNNLHLVQHLLNRFCLSSPPPIHLEVETNAGRWRRRVQRRRTTARRDFRSKQVICELSKTYLASAFSTVKLTSRLVLLVGEWLT